MKKERFWNYEKIFSTAAVVTSIFTILVFTYQTMLIREQNRMSVFPYLTLGYNYTIKEFSYLAVNKGVGPALIKSIKITDKEKDTVYDSVQSYVADLRSRIASDVKGKFIYYHSYLGKGRLIPANSEVEAIKIAVKNTSEKDTVLEHKIGLFLEAFDFKKAFIEVEYESIYGEKWKATNDYGSRIIPEKME